MFVKRAIFLLLYKVMEEWKPSPLEKQNCEEKRILEWWKTKTIGGVNTLR